MASLVSYEDSTGQVYFFDAESCKNWAVGSLMIDHRYIYLNAPS